MAWPASLDNGDDAIGTAGPEAGLAADATVFLGSTLDDELESRWRVTKLTTVAVLRAACSATGTQGITLIHAVELATSVVIDGIDRISCHQRGGSNGRVDDLLSSESSINGTQAGAR